MQEKIDIQISDQELIIDSCYSFVQHEGAGGNALFVGSVRSQTSGKKVIKLEFEAFESMARKELRKIAEAIMDKWQALGISIHHRTGTLAIGEIAVIIAVSAPHRDAAFEACQYAIDTLKVTVPIWKREYFDDGAIWVAAHP